MFLSKLVVKWLEWSIKIGLWPTFVLAFVAGFSVGDGFFVSLLTAAFFTITTGVFASPVFGGFIILADIRRLLTDMQSAKSTP